jgi:hypothetical protein
MPMRGSLKITFMDGSHEYFEVDPVGGSDDLALNLENFLASPNVTLLLANEMLIYPSTGIRSISITRVEHSVPDETLQSIPGVLLGVKRVVG